MQSSSNLFPVALISAERRGDLSEDVYRLKPGNRQLDSTVGAVARLETVDIFTQIATTLSADQGDGKQVAAALHNVLAQKRAASARIPALYR